MLTDIMILPQCAKNHNHMMLDCRVITELWQVDGKTDMKVTYSALPKK